MKRLLYSDTGTTVNQIQSEPGFVVAVLGRTTGYITSRFLPYTETYHRAQDRGVVEVAGPDGG
jgi:hypothetical protein